MDPKRLDLIKELSNRFFHVIEAYAKEQKALGRPEKEIMSECVTASFEMGLHMAASVALPVELILSEYLAALERSEPAAQETAPARDPDPTLN